MEIIKNIAAVIGCISACIALLTTVIKPLRQSVINAFLRKSQQKKLDDKMDEVTKKIDQLIQDNQVMHDEIKQVKKNVLENEVDRIRAELFDCGNRCRRKIRLHPEEMDHIRAIFHKYKDVLHENSEGEAEYNFIADYYNHQDFIAYHQPNN